MNVIDKQQQKKNQRLIIMVAAMSLIPFLIAWLFTKNPQWLSGRTNVGELILPPITTERDELIGIDQFTKDNLNELKGHWVMMNLIPGNTCNNACNQTIHKTRQIRLMMDKDLTRIRRVVVVLGELDIKQAGQWWQDDKRLLRVQASPSMHKKLKSIVQGTIDEGQIILMDPFGNLMMLYAPDFDPYDVKKDLKKLLRISQIG